LENKRFKLEFFVSIQQCRVHFVHDKNQMGIQNPVSGRSEDALCYVSEACQGGFTPASRPFVCGYVGPPLRAPFNTPKTTPAETETNEGEALRRSDVNTRTHTSHYNTTRSEGVQSTRRPSQADDGRDPRGMRFIAAHGGVAEIDLAPSS
jgi:hypothetical protein